MVNGNFRKMTYVGKVVGYSIKCTEHTADPGFLAVSPQVTLVINPVAGLPLLSNRPTVTFPANEITLALGRY